MTPATVSDDRKTLLPLTKRQHEVFEFIRGYIARHEYAPSLEEIGKASGLRSLATVHKHVMWLRDKGHITWRSHKRRSITIVPPPDCCPTCGRKLDNAA